MAEWKELGSKAKNLTLAGLGKARDLGESAKLSLENVSEGETRKRILTEIGKLYVSLHPDPEPGYEELYRQLREAEEKIESNDDRLSRLKDSEL